jgi:hypothetical protein
MTKSSRVTAAALALFAVAAHADGYVADSVLGNVILEQLGDRTWLHGGEAFAERDVIRVGAGGGLRLAFDRFGVVDLGPETEIAIEKLPSSGSSADAKTIITLAHGLLRVEWHRSAEAAVPLYVFFGSQRANISGGEYFFANDNNGREACAASGEATVMPSLSSSVLALSPSYCFITEGSAKPRLERPDAAFWVSARGRITVAAPRTEPAVADRPSPASAGEEGSNNVEAPLADPPPSASIRPVHGRAPSPVPATGVESAEAAWTLNLGSYTDMEAARNAAHKLTAAGYAPVVIGVQVDGRPWYRVQLRGFSTAAEARAKAEDLSNSLGFKGAWLVQQPYRSVSAAY